MVRGNKINSPLISYSVIFSSEVLRGLTAITGFSFVSFALAFY